MILFGTGIEAEKFYSKEPCKDSFRFVIDNYRAGVPFHGLRCYTLEEAKCQICGEIIVVATSIETYGSIKYSLLNIGLKEYKDFVFYKWYKTKVALFYGNCHIGGIVSYLQQNNVFNREYVVKYFCLNEGKPQPYPTKEDVLNADLIVCHDIRKNNVLNAPGYEWIKEIKRKETTLIIVPNLWGINFLWPQVSIERREFEENELRKHINSEAIIDNEHRSQMERERICSVVAGLIDHHDSFIESNTNLPTIEIAARIENDDIWPRETVISHYRSAIEKLKCREMNCDVKISDYIEKKIADVQLFYDEGHPHENIIFEKGRRILNILDMPVQGEEYVSLSFDSVEIFVYGCVRRALGMKWKKPYIRCKNPCYTMNGHAVSLEEFIDAYKAWICM